MKIFFQFYNKAFQCLNTQLYYQQLNRHLLIFTRNFEDPLDFKIFMIISLND